MNSRKSARVETVTIHEDKQAVCACSSQRAVWHHSRADGAKSAHHPTAAPSAPPHLSKTAVVEPPHPNASAAEFHHESEPELGACVAVHTTHVGM